MGAIYHRFDSINYDNFIKWNLYYEDAFGSFSSVRLIEGVCLKEFVRIVQCLLTINIQRLLCTVIKFLKVAKISPKL